MQVSVVSPRLVLHPVELSAKRLRDHPRPDADESEPVTYAEDPKQLYYSIYKELTENASFRSYLVECISVERIVAEGSKTCRTTTVSVGSHNPAAAPKVWKNVRRRGHVKLR